MADVPGKQKERKSTAETTADSEGESPQQTPAKETFEGFGTFKGVYIPSILTILGVIMFLRLGWVTGQAGLWGTIAIITLATSITLITGFSISAMATNMRVRGGGAYFIISRSFGIESGAAIGLPLYLAQATGVAFYLAGFAESVNTLLPQFSPQTIGLAALLVITVLAYISANLALKSQIVIFLLILASLASFILGSPLPAAGPSVPMPPSVPFWAVFAVFFPAVTGIEAGLSMSGDLKNPGRSLPWGIISAIVTGYAVYVGLAVVLWYSAPVNTLRANTMVMWDVALVPQAIYIGIWGATLSSAMGALLGGARTLQALAQDRVVPRFLGRGYGPGNDPRIATLITFAIGGAGLFLGNLNVIAPVLSMFFLTSYGTLNLISALEGLIGNPSWRPTFRTPWKLSLLGAGVSLATMLMIDPGAGLIAIFACSVVYSLMRRRQMRSRWSDLRGGILRALARFSIYTLSEYQVAARTWRPNILLFSGSPSSRWHLVELADGISHGKGFLTIAVLLEGEFMEEDKVTAKERSAGEFMEKRHTPSLVRIKRTEDIVAGMEGLIADYGLGNIEPNTIMLGASQDPEKIAGFCQVIKTTHFLQKNLLIVRGDAQDGQTPRNGNGARNAQGTQQEAPKPEDYSIDIWFSSQSNNSTLMLVYAYMLKSSPEWRGAKLTIKTLMENEDGRRGVQGAMEAFLENSRIEGEIEVYVRRPDLAPLEEIARYSAGSDMVFLGLRAPELDETPEAYSVYYREILEHTANFPLTIITLAGQKLSFKDIFN